MEEKLLTVLEYFLSLHEADAVNGMIFNESFTANDILEYIKWCDIQYMNNMSSDVELWLKEKYGTQKKG